MKIYKNINTDNLDTFYSTLGNELVFENDKGTFCLLPAYNVGFYENKINPAEITVAYNKVYFLFYDIFSLELDLSLYKDNLGSEFSGKKISSKLSYFDNFLTMNKYYLEGVCHRHNSFSYGSYIIYAENMDVVFLDNSDVLNLHYLNDKYKISEELQNFLLNRDIDISIFKDL